MTIQEGPLVRVRFIVDENGYHEILEEMSMEEWLLEVTFNDSFGRDIRK